MNHIKKYFFNLCVLFILIFTIESFSQNLYTARGYWEETNKETYRKIKQKQNIGDSLTINEESYLKDYEAYLFSYFEKLSPEEKEKYAQMKNQWDRDVPSPKPSSSVGEEFEFRTRDRLLNTLYGIWYGTSLVILADIDGAAAAGIPLITGGIWLLGPAMNPKKYDGITQTTIRASNGGKFLGLMYGASLALALGGDNDNTGKLAAGLSSVGSIALGEIGFHWQKKNNITDGHVEMMRHYGFLGPWVSFSAMTALQTESVNAIGASLLAGGIAGLSIGNKVSQRYDYTRGDVDAVQSLTWIATGLGFAVVINALENNNSEALFLIPAASSIAGTVLGQQAIKGAYLTKKQGSTLNLATAGSALIGLGILTIAESDSPAAWLAVPSVLALVAHQITLSNYKRENLEKGFRGSRGKKHDYRLAMNVMPENYFINKHLGVREQHGNIHASSVAPLVKLKIGF